MFELFSRRNRKIENDPDIYEYKNFNERLRTQLYFALTEFIEQSESRMYFFPLYNFLLKEFGMFSFTKQGSFDYAKDFSAFWMTSKPDEFIDLLDSTIYFLNNAKDFVKDASRDYDLNIKLVNLNGSMNFRLKQHNLGYEIIDDKLRRIDNMLIHVTIVKPVLFFLHQKDFKGAEEEIYGAFDYLKVNDYKNTVLYASKAFESTMKTICSLKKYKYNKDKDTAKELINNLVANKYIPQYSENHLHAVRTTLENGLPTLRNKTGGHGQGDEIVELPSEFARYALNLACTNILFLADLY